MKQAVLSLLAVAFIGAASFAAPVQAATPQVLQTSPPVLCVIDGCNDPYPGPQR